MATKQEAIAALDASYDKFRGNIAGLDEAAMTEVWLGTWSVEQLLAHMAGWYREMTGAFGRVAKGERPVPEGVDYSDADTWNAKFSQQSRRGKDALADFDAAFAAYRAQADALDGEKYGEENGRPRIGNRLLQGSGIGHFEEHQGQLDDWLATRK
ncbi:MAG: maleylpyruvate isomerase N-terminal domain-containing protein [Dehalococcoidia bacterium]